MSEVTDAGVAQLAALSCLQELELQFGWQFGDAGIAALTRLSALTRLDLMYRCGVLAAGDWLLEERAGVWEERAGPGVLAGPPCWPPCPSACLHHPCPAPCAPRPAAGKSPTIRWRCWGA